MNDAIERIIASVVEASGFEVLERLHLPDREAVSASVPSCLSRAVSQLLSRQHPNGLYAHQAAAIDAGVRGEDVCLATSTASGKSLVFIATAAELLERYKGAKVLVLYPARALVHDQVQKWKSVLQPLGRHVGVIDGGVPTERRAALCADCDVVLMTPDVLHAWLMANLSMPEIARFLASLRLLVLDETHVYDGVFGTNMAYLLRRLRAATPNHQVICATATIGKPENFIRQLTGRQTVLFGAAQDGSRCPPKDLLLLRGTKGKDFEGIVALLKCLAQGGHGRFIAFGDSRAMVEKLVSAVLRNDGNVDENQDDETPERGSVDEANQLESQRVLPYRAGYEADDRVEIQKALAEGRLAGVVSTSALELGLDIGEVDLVILLSTPPSMKAFWQRFGRAGRRNPGVCILIDSRGTIAGKRGGLQGYLQREIEPSWIYLDNRYIQFANALCAAVEYPYYKQKPDDDPFATLPVSFAKLLANEVDPTEAVAADLYALKQRAQAGPHWEFPLRNASERSFQIRHATGALGTVTFPQMLHEAYPGAVYYYMARPYRVYRLDMRKGEILCKFEKRYTTSALSQTMVFPRFAGGTLRMYRSNEGFVAETEMQVSERVVGFMEQRGSTKRELRYNPLSIYSQRDINRFFETTGVCWFFPERRLVSLPVANLLLAAFGAEFGIQERDLGAGAFHSKQSPLGGACQGICIFDATSGSLRLTERLAVRFDEVVRVAISLAEADLEQEPFLSDLRALAEETTCLDHVAVQTDAPTLDGMPRDWVDVVAPGQIAVFSNSDGASEDVEVIGYRYSPQGLVYDVVPPKHAQRRTIQASSVQPINGTTGLLRVNLVTGEQIAVD